MLSNSFDITAEQSPTSIIAQVIRILKVHMFSFHSCQMKKDLRSDTYLNLLRNYFMNVAFFRSIVEQQDSRKGNDILHRCLLNLSHHQLYKDGIICKQGEKGEIFYIILKVQGKVGVFICENNETQQLREVSVLQQGQSFGELALLSAGAVRSATIKCKTECHFACLTRTEYCHAMDQHGIANFYEKLTFLINQPFVKALPYDEIKSLSYKFHEVKHCFKSVVYTQGRPNKNLFLIKAGEFELHYRDQDPTKFKKRELNELEHYVVPPKAFRIVKLGPGMIFGEEAMLQLLRQEENQSSSTSGSQELRRSKETAPALLGSYTVVCTSQNGVTLQLESAKLKKYDHQLLVRQLHQTPSFLVLRAICEVLDNFRSGLVHRFQFLNQHQISQLSFEKPLAATSTKDACQRVLSALSDYKQYQYEEQNIWEREAKLKEMVSDKSRGQDRDTLLKLRTYLHNRPVSQRTRRKNEQNEKTTSKKAFRPLSRGNRPELMNAQSKQTSFASFLEDFSCKSNENKYHSQDKFHRIRHSAMDQKYQPSDPQVDKSLRQNYSSDINSRASLDLTNLSIRSRQRSRRPGVEQLGDKAIDWEWQLSRSNMSRYQYHGD